MLELINPGFCKWLCQQVQELEMHGQGVITLPFRPRCDEQIVIYIERQGDMIRIHDEGETLGNIFIDSGMDVDNLSRTQKEYINYFESIYGVRNKGLECSIETSNHDPGLNQKILNLIQFIIQISHLDVLQESPREFKFSQRVYNEVKQKVKGVLKYNHFIEFAIDRSGESRTSRKVDLFKENGNIILGRTLYSKSNVDKVLTTWDIVEDISKGTISSLNLIKTSASIKKATICNETYDDDVYIHLLEKKSKVFFFPDDEAKIVDFFNG